MERRFPIECDDLTPAPSAPGSVADRAALAEHLAACPRCASQAGRDAALIRLWEATRPDDPDEATWDALWARVADRLDAAPAGRTETLPFPFAVAPDPSARRWRQYAVTAFVAAQAAALLAAAVLWGAHRPSPEAPTAPAVAAVDIEPGEVVMIHLEGRTVRAVAVGHEEQRPDTLDENLVLFNDAEAMAGMQDTFAEIHHHAHAAPPPG